jgi:hypothetical protein
MQRLKTSTKPPHDQNINNYGTKLRAYLSGHVYGRRHRNGLANETPVRNLSPQFSVPFHASCGNAKVNKTHSNDQ